MSWYIWISRLCVSPVIWMQTLSVHTPLIENSPFLPPLLDSFAIMLPSGGEMDAFNHLSYQLCAKQQPH